MLINLEKKKKKVSLRSQIGYPASVETFSITIYASCPQLKHRVAASSFHQVVMKIRMIKQDLDNIVMSTGETLIILILEGCLNSMHQRAAYGTGKRRMDSCSLTE